MPLPTSGYCSDEDLAVRAGADWADLVPRDQLLAAGNDGTFASGSRWVLTSATVPDFAAQGVAAGMVALVALPRLGLAPEVQQLAVDSIDAGNLTLRRKGLASGLGQPPGPPGGFAGAEFTVATLSPQILRASYDLDRRYGVDDLVAGRRTSDLYDPTELMAACVLTVLVERYAQAAREAGDDAKDGRSAALWAKRRQFKSELDDLIARVALHWKPIDAVSGIGPGSVPATTRFGLRISR